MLVDASIAMGLIMSIKNMVAYSATGMILILAICVWMGTMRLEEIRMGGPIQMRSQQASDLIADILPPPEYVIEAYLEATKLANQPNDYEIRSARLKKLRADYDDRHAYWLKSDLEDELKREITHDTHEPAVGFWNELENRFLPAVAAHNYNDISTSYAMLTEKYNKHRAEIDRAVGEAIKYQSNLSNYSKEHLQETMTILGGLVVILFSLVSTFCLMIFWRVILPVRKISAEMRQMATGKELTDESIALRKDEIGDVARALQEIVVFVAKKSQIESERQLNIQRKVVTSLGVGLSHLKNGILHYRINDDFPTEYEVLRDDFNEATMAVHQVIDEVVNSVESLHSSANEINSATQDLSERTERQAANLEETAAAMRQLTEKVRETAEASHSASVTTGAAQREGAKNGVVVDDAVGAMGAIERSSEAISQIVTVIESMAFQTNLLALNAGVEAARAGDAGQGFAVVASEVRALAQRSDAAAKDIKELITKSGQQVGDGVVLVGRAGDALKLVLEKVGDVSLLIQRIADAAGEQANGLGQVGAAIASIDHMTQQNAAMSEECNAAARLLNNEANRLSDIMSRFDIGRDVSWNEMGAARSFDRGNVRPLQSMRA